MLKLQWKQRDNLSRTYLRAARKGWQLTRMSRRSRSRNWRPITWTIQVLRRPWSRKAATLTIRSETWCRTSSNFKATLKSDRAISGKRWTIRTTTSSASTKFGPGASTRRTSSRSCRAISMKISSRTRSTATSTRIETLASRLTHRKSNTLISSIQRRMSSSKTSRLDTTRCLTISWVPNSSKERSSSATTTAT